MSTDDTLSRLGGLFTGGKKPEATTVRDDDDDDARSTTGQTYDTPQSQHITRGDDDGTGFLEEEEQMRQSAKRDTQRILDEALELEEQEREVEAMEKRLENQRRQRRIRERQNKAMMDHVLTEFFELDPDDYEDGFINFLDKERIQDINSLTMLSRSAVNALGFDIPHALYMKMRILRHIVQEFSKSDDATNNNMFLKIMALTNEDFTRLGDQVRERIEALEPSTPQPTATDMAPAGMHSRSQVLRDSRRKSQVIFVPPPNVSTKRGSSANQNPTPGINNPAPNNPGNQPPNNPANPPPNPQNPPVNPPNNPPANPPNPGQPPNPPNPPAVVTAGGGGGGNAAGTVVQYVLPPTSKASEFDKAGRRSSSDYEKFSNKEQWSKWQRATLGTAYEHKCEQVLDPTYTPDPSDADEVALFANKQRFMYSVFSKVLTEGKAADILRNYSNPTDKTKFGDAQAIYSDLCDHFDGGAQARVSAQTLEVQLTTMRLNKTWTKSVRAFVNKVAHVIRDHKEATNNVHDELYYIEKLNTTFSEHNDMQRHIQSMETQEAMLTRRMGGALLPHTYESQLHELSEYATVLDDRYAKNPKRNANKSKSSSDNNGNGNGDGNRNANTSNSNQNNGNRNGNGNYNNNGGRNNNRNGGNNNYNGGNRNRNNGNNQNGSRYGPGPGFISNEEWNRMSGEERKRVHEERARARGRQSNNTNQVVNDGSSTIAGPPTTIQVQEVRQGTQMQAPTQQTQPGSMLRNMMSAASARSANAGAQRQNDDITINGTVYRRANVTYRVSKNGSLRELGALIDGGANGGVIGDDARILEYVENATVDLTGIGDIEVASLKLGLGAAVVETVHDGPIIVLMAQYADLGKGKTIHSKGQMEHFGAIIDDKSRQANGRQCIITHEGYVLPLHVRDGLPRLDMRPPTDDELDKYPHVYLTSDTAWDPTVLDNEYDESFYDAVMEDPEVTTRREQRDPRIDDRGYLRDRDSYVALFEAQDEFIRVNSNFTVREEVFYDAHATAVQIIDPNGYYEPEEQESVLERAVNKLIGAFPNRLRKRFPSLDKLKPYFGWASNDRIKTMLDKTTQHYRGVVNYPFRKHFKSRFPAANVPRMNEWVATDTYFCDTPAADDGIPGHAGATMVQLYLGLTSGHVSGYPMTSETQIPQTLEDQIRKTGAPIGLMSDQAKAELHGQTKELLRMYEIGDRQSEGEYQHQNPAERKIQDVKKTANGIMDRTGCPNCWWLLATLFTIMLMNYLPNSNGEIPYTCVTGQIGDISKFMHFHFWQEVFVESHRKNEKEELARWCFPAENVGDELTYWVLLDRTKQLVTRSNVRPAKDPLYPNLRQRPRTDDLRGPPTVETVDEDEEAQAPATSGESERPTRSPIYNVQDNFDVPVHLPRFSPEELLGLTFLHELPDGQRVRAKIVKKIMDRDAENHQRVKMLVSYDDDKVEEVIAYNELCDIVEEQHDKEASGEADLFTFREVLRHEGPLKPDHPSYRGSSYNVLIAWSDGTETWEPLGMMITSDPATMAAYASEHDLLDTPGWKKLKRIGRRAKVLRRMLNASKRAQRYNEITYKFGVRVPRSVEEARRLDAENGNTLWQEAMDRELAQIKEYEVCHSLGKNGRVPPGYQLIPVRMVFDVKQDLKRKGRLVARGDKTIPPADTAYSGVASLRSLRMVAFLAELNGLELTGGDIGNAYLEAYTKEKVCFRAGPEFGEWEGHLLVVDKALYGLRTSGERWHAKFADTLRRMGFSPSYADPDVWLRDAGDCYEYVVVYVDDIFTALKNPKEFYEMLQGDPWNYKLKNVEEPKYHLGGDFFRDNDGTYCYGAQTYLKRLLLNYKLMFGEMPTEYHAPLEKNDQPELDDTPLCGPEGIKQFQSIIGAVQWTISLCRFDILHAVMSLGRFRAAPREGHLERLKRMVGYLKKRPHGAIRFRTEIPNHEATYGDEPVRYDWMETVYGRPKEDIDPRAPTPKGKMVRTTSFCDANLMHDAVTGRSATGIMEFLNQTPIDWFAKRQNQVESATYGSEFMAARQAVERIQDLRYTLRSFGVPIEETAWLFGDNQSVVTSSTIPHSRLSKRWNALSYHKVREAVAGGWLRFEHLPGTENPADIFTKPLPWATMRTFVEPLLFWKGETAAPTGNPNPEGSDAGPGLNNTRDSNDDVNDENGWIPVIPSRASARNANPTRAGIRDMTETDILWNNQYATLND